MDQTDNTPLTQTDLYTTFTQVANLIAQTAPWLALPPVTLMDTDYLTDNTAAFGFHGTGGVPCVVIAKTARALFDMPDAELGKYLWWRLQQQPNSPLKKV